MDEIPRLQARVAALEDLLEVHERTALDQARRLEQALRVETEAREQLETQTAELEMQAEQLEAQAVQMEEANFELEMANHDLQLRETELGRLNAELERLLSARSRFYASMSHELRTPINAILGYTDLILAGVYGEMSPEQVQGIERTRLATRHLLELVNDILDLSKIEAGKADLQVEETDLRTLVKELLITIEPVARDRGSSLAVAGCEGPILLVTDARRVRQILLNLLSNAVRHGGGTPVTVRCSRPSGGGVEVDIVDEGEGIAEEDLHKIFEEFVQLSTSGASGGTGLGLPISKRLARLLGGDLTVRSRPGDGSVFRLSLPAVPPSAVSSDEPRPEEPLPA